MPRFPPRYRESPCDSETMVAGTECSFRTRFVGLGGRPISRSDGNGTPAKANVLVLLVLRKIMKGKQIRREPYEPVGQPPCVEPFFPWISCHMSLASSDMRFQSRIVRQVRSVEAREPVLTAFLQTILSSSDELTAAGAASCVPPFGSFHAIIPS